MPRLPRMLVPGAVYLVTCRGEHSEKIFKEEKDYGMFLELLKKYQEQYSINVFAFCLLPDHLHLLLEMDQNAGQDPAEKKSLELSDFMRDLNNNYTKYFNGRYDRKGHLFRERFKSAIIEKKEWLLKMTAYIHLNPQALNLTDDAKKYPFSSYRMYMHDESASRQDLEFMSAAVKEALSLLSDLQYVTYCESMAEEEKELIHKKLSRGGILGSDEFIAGVRREAESFQAKNGAQRMEAGDAKNYKVMLVTASLIVFVMASAGLTYLVMVKRPQPGVPQGTEQSQQQPQQNILSVRKSVVPELELKDWKIRLVPSQGGSGSIDVLSFLSGAFSSEKTNSLGMSKSSYSRKLSDDGTVIWQVVQAGPESEASWRGEMHEGIMRGIMVLRQKGKEPQDFSFVSAE